MNYDYFVYATYTILSHVPRKFHHVREIGKSKTIGSVCGWIGMSIPNMVGIPPSTVVPLGHWVGKENLRINITSAA